MKHLISIIIPNYNAGRTIGMCLQSIFACGDRACEVIVVDDCSEDDSVDVISSYPCTLIAFEKHAGASAARNAGAFSSKGDVLFFMDADCLLKDDTLSVIRRRLSVQSAGVVVGGTYTPVPHDPGFFSLFQSVFINYFETKNSESPDYLATHALVIHAETFKKTGGFPENFLPILEDVEFCHRLKRSGYKLIMDPDLQVRHVFNLTLLKSLRNAARKTRFWMRYSLGNGDLFADSGTASREIKMTGAAWLVTVGLALLSLLSGNRGLLMTAPFLWVFSVIVNRSLLQAFYESGGILFAIESGIYYLLVYPAAVWAGTLKGIVEYASLREGSNSQCLGKRQG